MNKIKRIKLFSLALTLCLLLCSCAQNGGSGADSTNSTNSTNSTGSTEGRETELTDKNTTPEETEPQQSEENTDKPKETYKARENYLSEDALALVNSALAEDRANTASKKHFISYSPNSVPYATKDVYNISEGKLISISLPICKVKSADADGNYVFTVFVVGNSYSLNGSEGLKSAPLRSYKLKVKGSDYGFKDNTSVYTLVKINVEDLNITLSNNETLAYMSPDDTMLPGYIFPDNNELRKQITEICPQTTGFYSKVGTKNLEFGHAVLILDFTFEKEYESESAYREKEDIFADYQKAVSQIKSKYEGKYVSVIGDSISTFEGVSNSTSYNSTIGDNAVYFNENKLVSPDYTYWGRLIKDTGMKLCVNNSWSGGRAYGTPKYEFKDSTVLRSTELDNDNGTPNNPDDDISPDVIILYIGTNDVWIEGTNSGDLYSKLQKADKSEYINIIDKWMKELLVKTENGTKVKADTDYTTFEQAYALTLYRMMNKYKDAEIYVFNVLRPENYQMRIINKYNFIIEQINEYFKVTTVNQYEKSGISYANHHSYMLDKGCTHPSAYGHFVMSKMLAQAMADKMR